MIRFDGNADFILLEQILRNSVIISEDLKQKFYGMMLTIRQEGGPRRYGDEIRLGALELKKDLLRLSIFKEEFITNLTDLLISGIEGERKLQNKK